MSNLYAALTEKDSPLWGVLRGWHASLETNRGERAALRRAKSPEEVFLCPAYHRGLVRRLREAGIDLDHRELILLALPVGVLATAKTLVDSGSFARLMAMHKGSDQVRDTRFRRLLAVGDQERDELFRMLRRLVCWLDESAHLFTLVRGGCWWNESTRRDWATSYYTSNPKNS